VTAEWVLAAGLILQSVGGAPVTAFAPEADGVRHVSGFFCPAAVGEAKLAKSENGSPIDGDADNSAFCEYQEDGQRVGYLLFSRTSGPVLTDAWCKRLPASLRLQQGPRLPGVSKYEEVEPISGSWPSVRVDGSEVQPVACTLARAPFTPGIIVYSATAFQHQGWTVRAINTPLPPPCCNGYPGVRLIVKDLLGLVLISQTAERFRRPAT